MSGTLIMLCASLMAIDGDTVRCCENVGAQCEGQTLRPMRDGAPDVSGFDTPEVSGHARCAREAKLGLQAGARFAELLRTPGFVVEDSGETDAYDRPLLWLRMPDGTTIGQTMIDEGLARPWRPGQRNDWCSN